MVFRNWARCTRPKFLIAATLRLSGDHISGAPAKQIGGIGIAPCASLSDVVAMYEANHGTACEPGRKDDVNPSSEILSAEMMLIHTGWIDADNLIIATIEKSIVSKKNRL